jgi:hypothetical protein
MKITGRILVKDAAAQSAASAIAGYKVVKSGQKVALNGQVLAKRRVGSRSVGMWSNRGQIVVKPRSNRGPTVVE